MIRSRSIPAVLSRVAGDGIHAILLVDINGELLGSHGSPPPPPPKLYVDDNNGGGESSSSAAAMGAAPDENDDHWPLDAASIGALISEVAGDYRRMGEELLLLDPEYDLFQQGSLHRQDSSNNDGEGGDGGGGSTSAGVGGANGKDKSGTNLKTIVIDLEYGVVGVASAGPDFYVIVLADLTMEHGALVGRLRSLGAHVGEALSHLD